MLRKVYYTILFLQFQIFVFAQTSELKLVRDSAYPQWLKSGEYRTDQTSGITFIDSYDGKKIFLLADDIGAIHKLVIVDDCIIKLYPVHLSADVMNYFQDYPKTDFEEIVYDRHHGKFYVSVEGHTTSYKDFTGIFEIKFNENLDTLVSVSRIEFEPEELFMRYINWNIGYEGLAVDSNYFYLGLEGFLEGKAYSDSSVIFIAEKKSKKIIKSIYTGSLGINTITGLYSDKDLSIWLLDRNQRKIFYLQFDDELNLISNKFTEFEPVVPGYDQFNYIGSYESITKDDEGNLYIVDDPWRQFFIPPDTVLNQFDDKTIKNFRENIPIIDRYQLKSKGACCGKNN